MKRTLIEQVRELSGNRCDYCHLPDELDPLPFQLDHIIAQQHGGLTVLENSAWSCLHCNKHKGRTSRALIPSPNNSSRSFTLVGKAGIAISNGTAHSSSAEPGSAASPSESWPSTIPMRSHSVRNSWTKVSLVIELANAQECSQTHTRQCVEQERVRSSNAPHGGRSQSFRTR